MSACTRCRDDTGGTGVLQGGAIPNGDGRGGAIAQTAGAGRRDVTEAEDTAVDKDGAGESVGAGKDERTRTGLDEGQGRRATDTRIHRDGAGTVMLENQVRRG